jgi:DnaJ-domain-containing protein 1
MSLTLINNDDELLKDIERDVQYIRDMAYELDELVNKQREPLNNLETSIMNTTTNIKMSERDLAGIKHNIDVKNAAIGKQKELIAKVQEKLANINKL